MGAVCATSPNVPCCVPMKASSNSVAASSASVSRVSSTLSNMSSLFSWLFSILCDKERLKALLKKAAVYLLFALFVFMPLHVKCPWYGLILLFGLVGLKLHFSGIYNITVWRVVLHMKNNAGDLYITLFGVLVALALLLRFLSFPKTFAILVMLFVYAFICYCQCAEEPELQTSIPEFDKCHRDNLCSVCLAAEGIPEQTFQHNRDFLHSLVRGDVIAFHRHHKFIQNYLHTAIYIGRGMVIHKTCDNGGQVLKQGFWEVAETSKGEHYCSQPSDWSALPADEVVERAESKLGSNTCEYHPLTANCEHFTNWCKYGQNRSPQVERMHMKAGQIIGTNVVNALVTVGAVTVGAAEVALVNKILRLN